MKKLYKHFGSLALACFMAIAAVSCRSSQIVTQELYDAFDNIGRVEDFSAFRFYISHDVVLTEVTGQEMRTDNRNTRVQLTSYNNVVNLKRSTTGRVQGTATQQRLEISFQELRDGSKPTISFVQKRSDGRYYFEYEVGTWVVTDRRGNQAIRSGPGIQYNGSTYLLEFRGEEEPYLLYDQDVRVRSTSQTMRGIR